MFIAVKDGTAEEITLKQYSDTRYTTSVAEAFERFGMLLEESTHLCFNFQGIDRKTNCQDFPWFHVVRNNASQKLAEELNRQSARLNLDLIEHVHFLEKIEKFLYDENEKILWDEIVPSYVRFWYRGCHPVQRIKYINRDGIINEVFVAQGDLIRSPF